MEQKNILISESPVTNFHPKRGLRQAGELRNCQKSPLVIKEDEIDEQCLRLGSSVRVLLPGIRVPSPCPPPGAWVVLRSCQGVNFATVMIGKQQKPFSQGGEAISTCQHPAPVFSLTLDENFLPCCPPRSNSSSFGRPKSLRFLFSSWQNKGQ